MAKIYCSAVIPAEVGQVWTAVRDFSALPAWHPMIATSTLDNDARGDTVGAFRTSDLTDGARLREQLLALDDLNRSSVWTIVESSLPVVNFLAELRLRRVTADEHTFAEWIGQFDVADADEADACEAIATIFAEGLRALTARFAG